jgi:hypothetical protein
MDLFTRDDNQAFEHWVYAVSVEITALNVRASQWWRHIGPQFSGIGPDAARASCVDQALFPSDDSGSCLGGRACSAFRTAAVEWVDAILDPTLASCERPGEVG